MDVFGAGVYAALVVWLETDVIGHMLPLGPSFLSILDIGDIPVSFTRTVVLQD